MVRVRSAWVPLALALVTFGCDDDGDDAGADMGAGQQTANLYFDGEESAALGADGNEARCATCHSNDGTRRGFSGATMQDIAFRTSFKGGDAPDLLAATNACVTGWMGGEALTADDASWQSLSAYLESISDPSVTDPNPLAPEVLADEAAYEAAYAGGDAAAGEATYELACGVCHTAELTVNNRPSYPTATLAVFSAGRIAQKVRTSGPPPSGTADGNDSTPGPMPFFEPSDLSQSDLADIVAYLKAQSN
ncbi:MAG: c-type cytochrome [Myxococcales bacterium]|nr:c-type cytochrome [Myxococcales bacterium]